MVWKAGTACYGDYDRGKSILFLQVDMGLRL